MLVLDDICFWVEMMIGLGLVVSFSCLIVLNVVVVVLWDGGLVFDVCIVLIVCFFVILLMCGGFGGDVFYIGFDV